MSKESKQGRVIIVAGPPGSGKGTQCKILAAKHGFRHISTGDIFRDAVTKGTELGKKVAPYIQKGNFVPDSLVISLIEEYVKDPESIKNGVLIDGFPRTAAQAQALLSSKIKIERYILLQSADTICLERIMGRRMDPNDGKIYHLKFVPPTTEVTNRLVRREFDLDEKTIKIRLQYYYAQLGLILPYFKGKIQVVKAGRKIKDVSKQIEKCLQTEPEPLIEKEPAPSVPVDPPRNPRADPPAPVKSTPQCSVCYDADADHLIIPCGHQCGCKPCLDSIQQDSGKCPICRRKIEGLVKVFLVTGPDEEPKVISGGGYVNAMTGSKDSKMELHSDDITSLKNHGTAEDGGWGEDEEEEEVDKKEEKKGDKKASILNISVAPCEDIDDQYQSNSKVDIAVLVDVPDLKVRQGVDVCCVVDISGSMCSAAKYEDPQTKEMKDDGLSVLDVVKHAVKTVIHILGPEDRFSLVAFDEKAEIAFALGEMTEGIRKQALEALDKLKPRGQTSIWAGLLAGLDSLRTGSTDKARKKFILLLTDGQPNISPPRGHEEELLHYFETYPDFGVQVNTFGFGYSLSSDLLLGVATVGNGTYAFIPDSKIVGTCFVNSIANAISTLTPNAILHLIPKKESKLDLITKNKKLFLPSGIPIQETSWGYVANLGPLTYGNRYEFIVPMKLVDHKTEYLETILVYKDKSGKEIKFSATGNTFQATPEAIFGGARSKVIAEGFQVVADADGTKAATAQKKWASLAGVIAALSEANKENARIIALNEDVKGRMSKSLTTKERFNRWGKHYLRALLRGHQLQQCTNFMDPGLQIYGGSLFKEVNQAGGKIFITIPQPVPSRRRPSYSSSSSSASTSSYSTSSSSSTPVLSAPILPSAPTPQVQMQDYYAGSGGGCFGASCTVIKLCHGKGIEIPLTKLRKGDQIKVMDGEEECFASVLFVVKIQRPRDKYLLRLSSGLIITPKHPIRINDDWRLPSSLSSSKIAHDGWVYNVILDRGHVLLVNGMECITWGHNLKGDDVRHPFYGSSLVVENIRALEQQQQQHSKMVEVRGTWQDNQGQVVGLW